MEPASFCNATVCVMDASGHLGSALVRRLLQGGYIVHAAVQNHGVLSGVSADNKNLKAFCADPFDCKSIIDALRGCSGLFYAFEPPEDHPTYDEFMAEIEVRAAHNVLEVCAQTDSINKVVFTSSANAVFWRESSVMIKKKVKMDEDQVAVAVEVVDVEVHANADEEDITKMKMLISTLISHEFEVILGARIEFELEMKVRKLNYEIGVYDYEFSIFEDL
ncbi:hypothetical protein K2173_002802 [Erythroxylum novogranatense]|uniref:3-beta hydroxysteroid dehydrogenase/isomerase domain-containing protein n=1 Tax=Erythroxylum novogranatense TaxID=1862640 RepID=A0AAV8SQR1_9ROSI|nr:hypothetical protein K2173_002802 [Erythroxylum novogranatense]